jgi:hypothetical protein
MAELRKGNIIWKDNLLPNSPENPVHSKDVNSQNIKSRLDLLATETKLEQARALLASLDSKDFAKDATLTTVKNDIASLKADIALMKTAMTDGNQKVQLSGTITTQELSVSTMGAGDVTEQIQTWIVDPNQASKLIGVFANIRSEAATSGDLVLRGYVGDISSYMRIFEIRSTSILASRVGVGIHPYNIPDFCEISSPVHIERDISAYLEHCARFTFGAGTPLILELSSTVDAGISNPVHRQLRVWYTS